MKRLIATTAIALGLTCAASASAAEYETYQVDLGLGYAMIAFVGDTPAGYVRAQHLAKAWEGRRHLGLGPMTVVGRAIDNSSGVAKQAPLPVPDNEVAYVHVH
jgi:hypothetical protein